VETVATPAIEPLSIEAIQAEPQHIAPVVEVPVAIKPARSKRPSGVLQHVRFASAEMTLPPQVPELPVQAIDYPPFERKAVVVSGRIASVKALRNSASAPAALPQSH